MHLHLSQEERVAAQICVCIRLCSPSAATRALYDHN